MSYVKCNVCGEPVVSHWPKRLMTESPGWYGPNSFRHVRCNANAQEA